MGLASLLTGGRELEDHGTWLAIASMAISALGAAWAGWLQLQNNKLKAQAESNKVRIDQGDNQDNRINSRVDLIWKSNLRRGSIRAVENDMARPKDPQMNSITVTDPEVREAYQPLVPFLKEIRKRYPGEVAFTEKLLEEHGDWIIMHICKPLQIGEYECVAMAYSVSGEATQEHRIAALPPPA